jgi:hypothetical protein
MTKTPRHFILLGHPRAGNIFLTRILNQHPELFCAGEVFNVNWEHEHVFYARQTMDLTAPLTPDQLPKFFEACSRREARPNIGVTLFGPLGHGHTLSTEQAAQLVREGHPVLLLQRRNLLRSYCSWKLAFRSSIWHFDENGQPIAWRGCGTPTEMQEPLHIDVGEAEGWISRTKGFLEAMEAALRGRQAPWLPLYYEDLCCADPIQSRNEVRKIFEYLGVKDFPYTVKTLPTRGHRASGEIANRAELESRLGMPT